jgi:hypothetical protein
MSKFLGSHDLLCLGDTFGGLAVACLQHCERTLRIREQAFRKLASVGTSIMFSENSQSPPQPSPLRPIHTPMFRNLLIADLVLRDRIARTQWTLEYPHLIGDKP